MTPIEFIEKIAPLQIKYAKKYGYKICSAAIAQACLESQYGQSKKAKWNNFYGLKFRNNRVNCNSGYFNDGGSEQNLDGTYTPLPSNTAWYAFSDMEHGVEGYYQFLNIPNYAAVKLASTPLEYLQAIKNAGYATSLDYVQNVFKVVQKWGLDKYDKELAGSGTSAPTISSVTDIRITQHPGIANLTKKDNRDIQYIVLHYTAGTKSSMSAARNIAAYFNNPSIQASADFIVDDNEIVQYNPNPKNYYTWAVGGKKYGQASTSLSAKCYGQCTNQNSISIEMCSCKMNASTLNVTDDDWYLTDQTINNAVLLTKHLMNLYNIDINHVIMHHMVTGKWCPQPWCKSEIALTGWYNFLNKIQAGAGSSASMQPAQATVQAPTKNYPQLPFIVEVKIPNLNIRQTPNGTKIGRTTGIGKFTIVDLYGDWGKLKSGLGWIYLGNKDYLTY